MDHQPRIHGAVNPLSFLLVTHGNFLAIAQKQIHPAHDKAGKHFRRCGGVLALHLASLHRDMEQIGQITQQDARTIVEKIFADFRIAVHFCSKDTFKADHLVA